jgi:hypothetical protein
VWGTVVAVLALAVGISGIQQFGGECDVEPLFNGGTHIAAIALAGYSQRNRRSGTRSGAGILDEVFVEVNGKLRYLWRAVDHEGEVLEAVVTPKRD